MDKVGIVPRNDVVLVKRKEEEYSGTIVIPDNAKEKPLEAVVVAVGPGALMPYYDAQHDRFPMELAVGDVVFIGRYAGTEIEENGKKLLFLREHEILGKRA